MLKILSLMIIGIGLQLVAPTNVNREFFFNVSVLKQLLRTETDLILRILDQIAYQQQQLKVLSKEELYSRELEDVSSTANHLLLAAEKTIDMLTDLESLWPKVDDYVKKARNEIGLGNVTSSEGRCSSENASDDYEYAVFKESALRLCNGMIPLPAYVEKHLKCRYVDHGNLFLKIAPFKQEDVYLDPYIVIYHNVLTNDEIDMLQEEAYPMLEKARVASVEDGAHASQIRVAENTWLLEEDYPQVRSINRRAAHMTNLYFGGSEDLQIAYYKPGGYFNEHVDFDHNKENPFPNLQMGNRIGTLMFYLNDVQEGGKTIFTDLNVTLTPKKGNAVFWYNLLPNGDLDYYTMHAGCRVVSGVKWVANKWFHEFGQEFQRPCTLDYFYNEDRSGTYKL